MGWKSCYCCIDMVVMRRLFLESSRHAQLPHGTICFNVPIISLQHYNLITLILELLSPCIHLHASLTILLPPQYCAGCVMGDVAIVIVCVSNIDVDTFITLSGTFLVELCLWQDFCVVCIVIGNFM